ncbi:MAG: hypothetical protein ACK5Z2_09615 [Bacteroidota bacterium]
MWLSTVPTWLSVLFLIAIPIPVILVALLSRNAAKKNKAIVFAGIVAFFAAYFIYVYMACINKMFEVQSVPPQIVKLTTLPLMIFLVLVVFNLPFWKAINRETKASAFIRIHLFRLIGSFLLILSLLHQLPLVFGLIAGLGDVITALTSIYVARIIEQKKSNSKAIALVWNTFGLLDILATSTMAIVFTKLSIETGSAGVDALGKFPFCLIPAFAPPIIIFLHLSLYRKLLVKRFAD